jgi:hypothetical protein
MRTLPDSALEPTLILDNGRVLFNVPWRQAERFQELLQRQGVTSILYLDVQKREARLEPRTDLDRQQILVILKGK